MDEAITLVIADDHTIFREGLKLLIKKEPDFEIVAEATNGKELIDVVNTLKPNIVLTDIVMPEMDGIEATKIISKIHCDIGIIALSTYDQTYLITDMIEAGALGYLLKNAGRKEIIDAIHAVYVKQCYYSETISSNIRKHLKGNGFNPFQKLNKVIFNTIEREVIIHLCAELTSKEIASKMFLSKRTIEGHRQRIMEKIGARSTAGILMYAIKNGICKI